MSTPIVYQSTGNTPLPGSVTVTLSGKRSTGNTPLPGVVATLALQQLQGSGEDSDEDSDTQSDK